MKRAVKRDAVKRETFHFRKSIIPSEYEIFYVATYALSFYIYRKFHYKVMMMKLMQQLPYQKTMQRWILTQS